MYNIITNEMTDLGQVDGKIIFHGPERWYAVYRGK